MRDFATAAMIHWTLLICLLFVTMATRAEETYQDDPETDNMIPDRMARDFGSNGQNNGFNFKAFQDPNYRFLDWDALANGGRFQAAKRYFGGGQAPGFGSKFGSRFPGLGNGGTGMSNYLFSRNGRSFYTKNKPAFMSGGGGLGQDGLQDWSAFFERRGRRSTRN